MSDSEIDFGTAQPSVTVVNINSETSPTRPRLERERDRKRNQMSDIDHHCEREREQRERTTSCGTYPAKESCATAIYKSKNESCANAIYEMPEPFNSVDREVYVCGGLGLITHNVVATLVNVYTAPEYDQF